MSIEIYCVSDCTATNKSFKMCNTSISLHLLINIIQLKFLEVFNLLYKASILISEFLQKALNTCKSFFLLRHLTHLFSSFGTNWSTRTLPCLRNYVLNSLVMIPEWIAAAHTYESDLYTLVPHNLLAIDWHPAGQFTMNWAALCESAVFRHMSVIKTIVNVHQFLLSFSLKITFPHYR